MFFIIGALVVIGSVLGGYVANSGHMGVLWQPFEYIIIFGAAVGGYLIANPKSVLVKTGEALGKMFKGPQYNKASYLELLMGLYTILKTLKTKGVLAIEPHIEDPHASELFNKFPGLAHNHDAIAFICDYLRLMTMNADNPLHIETLMEIELDTHHQEEARIGGAFQFVADSMPALGIVAAVLGVIHTMGSITEPPEVLGHLIGGALVGTFFGVLVAYGFIGPMANAINSVYQIESRYMSCIKVAILAHLNGFAPIVSVEFARKTLSHDVQPTFAELEEASESVVI